MQAWTTLATVAVMMVLMSLDLAAPDLVLVGGLTALMLAGVLEPQEAFSGFSSPALATIAALFVVAAGARETGALDYAARRALGTPTSVRGAQMRIMAPVALLSAFVNNTPVVALFVPLLKRWAKQIGQPVSYVLMPLSYAAILGGMCTLIGTSTNLLVAGLYEAQTDRTLGMFVTTPAALPVLFAGIAYMVLASPRLLAARRGIDDVLSNAKEYAIAFRVEPTSPLVGETIEESLRSLPKLFLFELEREGQVYPAVRPNERLRAGDVLVFAGIVIDAAVDLRRLGLVPAADQLAKLAGRSERTWVEAVVASAAPIVGRSIREARFRTAYNAAVIAVHRQGERVSSKVGDIVLAAGDVLLIEASPSFVQRYRSDPNFVLVSRVAGSEPPKREKAGVAVLLIVAMVALAATGAVHLLIAALLCAAGMLLFRCIDGGAARRALDLRVIVTIGAAIGVGSAVESSGAARLIADALTSVTAPYGPLALMAGLFAVTAALSAFVYTATAAAVMFPIAAQAAESASLPLAPIAVLLMMAACSAFSTPIGYAANLMVYGPGGYRFSDFLKVGLPLQFIVGVVTVVCVYYFYLAGI
ncbi:MAG: SLC13 family permease [Myxococcota bacterium]